MISSSTASTSSSLPLESSDLFNTMRERVQLEIRESGIDPEREPERLSLIARRHLRSYNDHAPAKGQPLIDDENGFLAALRASLMGFGKLQALIDDESVEEIWINKPDEIFAARGGVNSRIAMKMTASEVEDAVERMLQGSGRRLDHSQPFVDASLADGSRVHVVIPNISFKHWAVNIRKFSQSLIELDQLVAAGSVPLELGKFLAEAVAAGQSFLISGATHTGKTTLLGALLRSASGDKRVITVEETFELNLKLNDHVALQCRQASLEGLGEVDLRRLLKEALRMRPDRVVVGEVRGAEALDLLLALNTGVPAGATIHANSARDAVSRLALLPLLAGGNIEERFVQAAIARNLDLVIHLARDGSGRRRVAEVLRVSADDLSAAPLFETVYSAEGFDLSGGTR